MIADIEATKVKPGTMTSSPGPMPSADSRIQIALVPELTATAWPTPTSSATLLLERQHLGAERGIVVGAVPAEVAAAQHAGHCFHFEFVDQIISWAWHGVLLVRT